MLYDQLGAQFEYHIKKCTNQLYYTSGIPSHYIDSDGDVLISIGEITRNSPFKFTRHLNASLVTEEIQRAKLFNTAYTHINEFGEHYFIYSFSSEPQLQGFIAMGPVAVQDEKPSNELAFMSKYGLSISEFQQFQSYMKALAQIAPVQEQYFINMLQIICQNDYDMSSVPIMSLAFEHVPQIPVSTPEHYNHLYDLEKQLSQHLFSDNDDMLQEIADTFSNFPKPVLANNNPLRSEQNLFISTVTLYSRFAIEAGLDSEIALSYSEYFIQEIERCDKISLVRDLLIKMIKTYKALVNDRNKSFYSTPVNQAIRYIDHHLTENISLVDVANHIGYSSKYLSEVFAKETGITFKTYINDKKLEIAKSLLLNPKNSILDICHYLGYCNQSYFSKIFKKNTGTSPSAFIKYHS